MSSIYLHQPLGFFLSLLKTFPSKTTIKSTAHGGANFVPKETDIYIIYYTVFQNVRNILQELHIPLTPDQTHKKVFQDIPVVGFLNGKSLKDHLVRAKLPNVEITVL